jgi:hypothetical protein
MKDILPLMTLCLGIVVGLFIGYSMNLEKDAQIRATKDCGICQSNLNTMVGNFNVLAKQCDLKNPLVKNVSILPGVINGTVKVYGP